MVGSCSILARERTVAEFVSNRRMCDKLIAAKSLLDKKAVVDMLDK